VLIPGLGPFAEFPGPVILGQPVSPPPSIRVLGGVAQRWSHRSPAYLEAWADGGRLPPRRGRQRLINSREFRHLGFFGVTRVVGGSIAGAAGVICLAYGVYPLVAFFLVLAAANLAGGYWYLSIDRSIAAQA
jgi:hypothetical protein